MPIHTRLYALPPTRPSDVTGGHRRADRESRRGRGSVRQCVVPEAGGSSGARPCTAQSNSADCSCAALAWTDQQSSSGIRHRANRVTNVPQNRRTVCTTESLLVYAKYITQSNKRHCISPHLDPYPTVVRTTWENNIKILPPVQSPINNGCSWTLLYNLSVR